MPSHQRTWAGEASGLPRVLIECPPSLSPGIVAEIVERGGYAVRTCEGPRETACHLLEEGSCALVAEADVVVNMLGTGRDELWQVLDAMSNQRRPPAIVAEATAGEAAEIREAFPEVVIVSKPTRATTLLHGIEAAIDATPESPTGH